jgi:hypothetical protein
VDKQMGVGAEWGDMQVALSPSGNHVAMAPTMGDPQADPQPDCAGYLLNPTTSDPMSGNATRWTHTCELGTDGTCVSAVWAAPVVNSPPESTPWPFFLTDPSGVDTLFHSRYASHIAPQGHLVASSEWVRYDELPGGTLSPVVLDFVDHTTILTPFGSPQ